jgi:hypothetical protein
VITAREATAALYGAWRLARFDETGMRYFDNTVEAFWRSFNAALVVLPAYALLVMLRMADDPPAAGALTVLVVQGISYVVGWFAFPFVMYYVTGWADCRPYFCRYIVAYNWATVLQITLFLFLAAIAASDILPQGMAPLLILMATLAILIYQGFIARVGLDVPVWGAAGIVMLDIVLSLVLSGYTNALMNPPVQTG